MRSISFNGLAQLAQRYGSEPIYLLEISWANVAAPRWYADRDVATIPGRIIECGDLDNVVDVSGNNSSQSLSVVLDDTDGSIKQVMDAHDIHKRTVRVYQYFNGLDLADKFLLFAGKITTPISWSERDRTVKFTILSQLEDKEVGFSAEEGDFPYLPADLVGKCWPSIFGKCLDVPALQINHAVQGTTLTGVGALAGVEAHSNMALYADGSNTDSGLGATLAQISEQLRVLWCAYFCWRFIDPVKADRFLEQINDLEKQRGQAMESAAQQQACASLQRATQLDDAKTKGYGANPIKILGGEDFPQKQVVTIDINGALFTGFFNNTSFTVRSRSWPDGEQKVADDLVSRVDGCPQSGGGQTQKFDFSQDVPCGCVWAEFPDFCTCRSYGFIVSTGSAGTAMATDPIMQQFWADAGATVRLHSSEPITYIVSITPGFGGVNDSGVLAVKAYKQFTGERRLINVPRSLWRVAIKNYGTVTAVQVVVNKPLSSIADQGWSDDLYVTYQSTIGPNTIDILQYLIDNYTDLSTDTTSFNYVETKLEPFPSNFPILERKNTLTVLQELAHQARCALWLSNGVFYIKYLPEEPDAVDTITVSDIDAENSVEVDLTPTEDLVTKMKVTWRMSWAPGSTDRAKDKSEKLIILRHNVTRYGIHEEAYNWYAYNNPDVILQAATFWLIRKSHTWKRLKFKTYLHKLNLETFDCVTFDGGQGYLATAPCKVIVEKATYDSANNLVDMECLTPVRSGSMSKFDFFWPHSLTVNHTWPPQVDIDTGDAGGGGIGSGASGELPIGFTDGIGTTGGTIFIGGPNVVFRARSDRGARTPTDLGFQVKQLIQTAVYAELDARLKPEIDKRLKLARALDPIQFGQPLGGITIDIAKTLIIDSDGKREKTCLLNTVFHGITDNGELTIRPEARVADDTKADGVPLSDVLQIGASTLCITTSAMYTDNTQEAEFDFRFDDGGGKYGAGTAFLQP